MNSIYYRVINDCKDSYYEVNTSFNIIKYPHNIAAEAAEDYYLISGGCESGWPLTISLHETEEGKEVARMLVEIEYEPSFYASKIDITKNKGISYDQEKRSV